MISSSAANFAEKKEVENLQFAADQNKTVWIQSLMWSWWCWWQMWWWRWKVRYFCRWTKSGVATRTEFTSAPSGSPSQGILMKIRPKMRKTKLEIVQSANYAQFKTMTEQTRVTWLTGLPWITWLTRLTKVIRQTRVDQTIWDDQTLWDDQNYWGDQSHISGQILQYFV